MEDLKRLIEELDGADVFLRNRANAAPAPLNEYDKAFLLDIAKTADEAARMLEKAIVPPCKVGDTVWIVDTDLRVMPMLECEVAEIGKDRHYSYIVCEAKAYRGRRRAYPFYQIGKTVFLTREEAEQALKARDEGK